MLEVSEADYNRIMRQLTVEGNIDNLNLDIVEAIFSEQNGFNLRSLKGELI